MLVGFRSRWTIPRRCASATARATGSLNRAASAAEGGRSGSLLALGVNIRSVGERRAVEDDDNGGLLWPLESAREDQLEAPRGWAFGGTAESPTVHPRRCRHDRPTFQCRSMARSQ